jgi:hypothetical protein
MVSRIVEKMRALSKMSVRSVDALTAEQVADILDMNADLIESQRAQGGGKVRFSLAVPDEICNQLSDQFGFNVVSPLPAQLVRGDTPAHVDRGTEAFKRTHLVYLSDSVGTLRISDIQYPIAAGRGYIFDEGQVHDTVGTEGERISLGPFNELQRSVGAEVVVNCSSLPSVSNPGTRPESLETEVNKSKVLVGPGYQPQLAGLTTSGSRTERLKAKVLAQGCCVRCTS